MTAELNEILADAWERIVDRWSAVLLADDARKPTFDEITDDLLRMLIREWGGTIDETDGTVAGEIPFDRDHFFWVTPKSIALFRYDRADALRSVDAWKLAS